MALVSSIVASALRKIRVVDAHSVPSDQEMVDSIDAMNRMVMRWEADGTALGYRPVSRGDDVLPVPIEAENAVIYNLAIAMGDEFGVAVTPSVAKLAGDYKNDLLRDVMVSTPMRARDSGSPMPDAGWGGSYDVRTDSYRS